MGILDELKKLTKPYNDEDYLEEDLQDPVRVAGQDNRSYASYAEPPRAAEPAQTTRRPYVFSQRQQQTAAYDNTNYAQQAYQQAYARQNGAYPQEDPYAQPAYQQPAYGTAQPKLLLVRPDRFELAADIADRIRERNAIVLNLESTQKDTTRRILDFLSGVTYALGGKVKRVAGNTYIITPAGMEFMGDNLEEPAARSAYF